MTNQEFIGQIVNFTENNPGNYVPAEEAVCPQLTGLKLCQTPLIGFAAAADELFSVQYKKEGVIHPEYMTPEEWLPGAKTVISFFLPFTKEVRESNRQKTDEPYEPDIPQRCSAEWLHARIEGQAFLNSITDYMEELMRGAGFETVCPTTSGKLRMITPYISTWSERHAAYAAGLGTFSLSKGLITEKGMAGRFGSIITTAEFSPSPRPYSDPFEYCVMCGACEKKCPAGAIDHSKGCALGKNHSICFPYLRGGRLPPRGPKQLVRYGCGKCQCGVPCESSIPGKKK